MNGSGEGPGWDFGKRGGGGEGVHVGSFYEKTVAIELAPECVCLFFFFFFFGSPLDGWDRPAVARCNHFIEPFTIHLV